jgi:multisubunit Na+/H+ antiporter MnhB subunit
MSTTHGDSPILRTVARFAVPLIIVVSLVIFYQGHNLPGGGFVAGVLVAAAGAVYLLAFGARRDGVVARFAWWKVSVVGLIISLLTGVMPMLSGKTFMDHEIWYIGHFHLPTATFFDLGVYLVVFGTLMTIFVELAQEEGV